MIFISKTNCFGIKETIFSTRIESLGSDLESIIKYISQLDELNTDGVEPTYQVFEMENVWRSDEILPQDADREALLTLAPNAQENQVKVPKVL